MEFHTSLGEVRGWKRADVIRLSRLSCTLPPLGARGFSKLRPVETRRGLLDTSAPSCVAPPSRLTAKQSEDCPHLDIRIPKAGAPTAERGGLRRKVRGGIAPSPALAIPRGTHLPWATHGPGGPVPQFDRPASCHLQSWGT